MALDLVGTVGQPQIAERVILGQWLKNDTLRPIGLQVLKRHNFTCSNCGFASRPSKQIPHGWMIPAGLRHPGLVPSPDAKCLCPMCVAPLALNWSVISKKKKGQELQAPGMLIYCPWIMQRDLNVLASYSVAVKANCRVGRSSAIEAVVRSLDAAISALNEEVGSNTPIYRGKDSDFARSLALLPSEYYRDRSELIGALRWWPNLDYWEQQGLYWYQASTQALHKRFESILEGLL